VCERGSPLYAVTFDAAGNRSRTLAPGNHGAALPPSELVEVSTRTPSELPGNHGAALPPSELVKVFNRPRRERPGNHDAALPPSELVEVSIAGTDRLRGVESRVTVGNGVGYFYRDRSPLPPMTNFVIREGPNNRYRYRLRP